ncbi:sodium:solute symporter family transporter [Candidatus Lariskella endosymbiont of Hedychridium roseum]|uniref:sodium:solute symporter family transporter n=1 Tax=Candidatus Lariskella endosymbiont of Hedychridium roseum TaxID=3077949 RepID=UPI0030CB8E73
MIKGLHTADIVIIVLYLAVCLILGLYKSRAVLNIREYAVGKGSFHDVLMVSAIFATFAGAAYTIGTVDKVYSIGLLFAVPRMFAPLFWLITIRIFAVNIEKFHDCITISDIMEKLYGHVGKWVTNCTALIVAIVATSIQALAIGQILNYFSGIALHYSVIIGMMVTILYSAFGGVRAIVLTDVLQFAIFTIAVPIACSFLYHDLGGYSNIIDKIPPQHLELNLSSEQNLIFFVSLIIYGLVPDVGGAFIQRFLMASGRKQLSRVLKIVALVNFPFLGVLCITGFLIQIKAPDIASDTAFIYFIDNYFSPGLKGLLVVALLAILMSTADSWLNYSGVLTAHDIIKHLFPNLSDAQELLVARTTTVLIGCIAIHLALYGKGLVELDWIAGNFWEPLVLVPLIAGFLILKTNYVSYIASAIFAVISTSSIAYFRQDFDLISFIGGLVGSAIGLFGSHYLQLHTGLLRQTLEDAELSNSHPNFVEVMKFYSTLSRNLFMSSLFYLSNFRIVLDIVRNRIKRNEIRNYTFSIFVIFHYLIPFFITNIKFNDPDNALVYFRTIAIFLCVGLIFADYWPHNIKKKFFAFYWYISLLFCLPFVATYTFFVTEMDEFWLLNTVLSVILLGLLVDSLSFVVLTSIGVALGYVCFYVISPNQITSNLPSHDIYLIGYLYAFLMLIIIVFIRGKEKAAAHKVTQMEIFGGAIAHEVKTPLAAIQMLAETLDIVTADFKIRAQKVESEKGVEYHCAFDERDFHILFDFLPKNLVNTSREGQKVVELLLLLLKHKVAQNDKVHSMRETINSALDDYIITYSLSKAQRNRIIFDKANDFYFCGPKQYIKQVFNNLMTNALKYAGDHATIKIWITDNSLHFQDDGYGIKPEMLYKLFQPFYSGNAAGNGIGLAFCEILISNMGGSIECISEQNVFTEFVIKLPSV